MSALGKIKSLIEAAIIKKQYFSKNRDYKLWIFSEWFGVCYYDNSYYFANYIAENCRDINVYWIAKNPIEDSLRQELHQRINILQRGTEEARIVYKKAGVVFMNQNFSDFAEKNYNYFGGATTVNLWHGVPWKRIGYKNITNFAFLKRIYLRIMSNLRGAEYFLCPSEKFAEICQREFGVLEEKLIKTGLPRNEIFYSEDKIKKSKKNLLFRLKQNTGKYWGENVKVITYMPTFRDNTEEIFEFSKFYENEEFCKWLERENIIILQKIHMISNPKLEINGINGRIMIFNDLHTQELLASTDLLITDYSSCFFDFLLLDRPIIHFLYDYEYYMKSDRGLFYRWEDVVGGEVAWTEEELGRLIVANLKNPEKMSERRKKCLKEYMTYDNQGSCKDILKQVMDVKKG